MLFLSYSFSPRLCALILEGSDRGYVSSPLAHDFGACIRMSKVHYTTSLKRCSLAPCWRNLSDGVLSLRYFSPSSEISLVLSPPPVFKIHGISCSCQIIHIPSIALIQFPIMKMTHGREQLALNRYLS